MKIEMDKKGILHIYPESEVEYFALKNWNNENEMAGMTSKDEPLPIYQTDKLIIHMGEIKESKYPKSQASSMEEIGKWYLEQLKDILNDWKNT